MSLARKLIAIVVLALPVGALVILTSSYFADGYYIHQGMHGLTHGLTAALLIVSAIVAWTNPKRGGMILILLGILLAVQYIIVSILPPDGEEGLGPEALQATLLIIAGPVLVSGIIFRWPTGKESTSKSLDANPTQ